MESVRRLVAVATITRVSSTEGEALLSRSLDLDTGLVAQVKASVCLAATHGTPFILYTEPDKELFFKRGISELVRQAVGQPEAGVILASRSDRSLKTFPPMQRRTEEFINGVCGDFIGDRGDYSYGPFLMNRALVPLIANLEHDIGWGWRVQPAPAIASKPSRGYCIDGITPAALNFFLHMSFAEQPMDTKPFNLVNTSTEDDHECDV
jgi:hypothetical protein